MTHPIDLMRATLHGRHLFASNDPHAQRDDATDDDAPAPRYCNLCRGGGHECPECSGWEAPPACEDCAGCGRVLDAFYDPPRDLPCLTCEGTGVLIG